VTDAATQRTKERTNEGTNELRWLLVGWLLGLDWLFVCLDCGAVLVAWLFVGWLEGCRVGWLVALLLCCLFACLLACRVGCRVGWTGLFISYASNFKQLHENLSCSAGCCWTLVVPGLLPCCSVAWLRCWLQSWTDWL